MKPIRQSALFAFVLGGLLLGVLSGCSAGNPNLSKAEDALGQENYDQALANIDSALTKDSADVEAYKMRAQILRQKADSTMAPEEYKGLYRRAREAEDMAVKFDSGARSEVEGQRRLAFTQQYQKGAQAFRRAQRTADSSSYRQAAAHFGAASATYPDSTGPILNEAYALLNMERMKQGGSMTNAIPVLERYLDKADEPQSRAYDILSALYLQDGQNQKAIDLLERARKDLAARPTYFNVTGSRGLKYSGTVEAGGSSREVSGSAPDRVTLDGEGTVTGTFQKQQEKGQLRVQLFHKGKAVQDTIVQGESATVSMDLSEAAPLAQLEGRLLNAYNRAGQTEKAMQEYRQQIEKNPNNATFRYNYGSMLLNENRYDAAIEQLKKAIEIEPGNARAQYNLGAAYTNQGKEVQDRLRAIEDSISSIRDAAMEENRAPTAEEKNTVNELDQRSKELAKKKRGIYRNAIPPLERARQLADSGSSIQQQACGALVQAYIQIEQVAKAKEYQECAGMQNQIQQRSGNQDGGGN
jgi:tetratricopeptide (TPR) repeat protein